MEQILAACRDGLAGHPEPGRRCSPAHGVAASHAPTGTGVDERSDERADEPRLHLDTVRAMARAAALLVTVGTSASTNLPWQVVGQIRRG